MSLYWVCSYFAVKIVNSLTCNHATIRIRAKEVSYINSSIPIPSQIDATFFNRDFCTLNKHLSTKIYRLPITSIDRLTSSGYRLIKTNAYKKRHFFSQLIIVAVRTFFKEKRGRNKRGVTNLVIEDGERNMARLVPNARVSGDGGGVTMPMVLDGFQLQRLRTTTDPNPIHVRENNNLS